MIVILCGLSGAGKTTLADSVGRKLAAENIGIEIIDADVYRAKLFPGLSFTKEDRIENVRRLGFIANTFSSHNIIPIISAICPYNIMRDEMINTYKQVKVIHIDCPLEGLIIRDTKGLYKRALLPEGNPSKISNLSGVNDPFERPDKPDLYINTYEQTVKESTNEIYLFIKKIGIKNSIN